MSLLSPQIHEAGEKLVTWLHRKVVEDATGSNIQTLETNPSGTFWLGRIAPQESASSSSTSNRDERLGGTATRILNNDIANNLIDQGFGITGGGGRLPEEFIPGPGGGVAGGTYVDITATDGASTIRVQTVDTLSDGITPTPREAAAAERIRLRFPNDRSDLVPK